MTTQRFFPVLVVLSSFLTAGASAQQGWGPDTLSLRTMQRLAAVADPRTRELQLHEQATSYRVRNIAAERLPVFSLETQSQYQSDVVSFGLNPAVVNPPRPPKDTYDGYLRIQQSVLDATNQPRRALERAQLVESQARVNTALFALRQEVNSAYFTAAQLQERATELAIVITDLEARLADANVRVRGGTALPSEAAAIQATLLQRRQDELEVRANRRAALEVLSTLTARELPDSVVLAVPSLTEFVNRTRTALREVRARPEYAQFASMRARLQAQERVLSAQQRPHVTAYARAGYGKPGLKVIPNEWDAYWLVGVQTQWRPFTWGSSQRERESLEAQREIALAEEAAFTRDIQRAIQRDLAAMDKAEAALALDDEIVALRERIERETRIRFDERVVTAADYLDRRSDVLEARLARARHRVELAQAQAQFLTTLGLEVQ